MKHMGLLVAVCAILILACSQSAVEEDFEVAAMLLPKGHPDAGREAFVSIGCVACHSVAWEMDLPAPTSAAPGPELGVDASQPTLGGLATSIIAPSHRVAEKYRDPARGDSSPMPTFVSTMTVQQLTDLVAHFERQGLRTQSKIGQ